MLQVKFKHTNLKSDLVLEIILFLLILAQEIFGIKAIIMYIHALPVSKKNVPPLLKEPINLVRDIKLVVEGHKNDEPEKAVTGHPLLHWPGIKSEKGKLQLYSCLVFL